MPRYFLNLRNGAQELRDPEGMECESLQKLRRTMLVMVRDMLSADIREGVVDLSFRLDAEDEDGAIVDSLAFEDAVKIIPGRPI